MNWPGGEAWKGGEAKKWGAGNKILGGAGGRRSKEIFYALHLMDVNIGEGELFDQNSGKGRRGQATQGRLSKRKNDRTSRTHVPKREADEKSLWTNQGKRRENVVPSDDT